MSCFVCVLIQVLVVSGVTEREFSKDTKDKEWFKKRTLKALEFDSKNRQTSLCNLTA